MPPIYKKALVLGATSGIGEALAAKLVSEGTKVVVVGRRQANLDAFVQKHGKGGGDSGSTEATATVTAARFDVTDLDAIKPFAASITAQHPDLDCVVVNSGVQRAFDFARPEEGVDLAQVALELNTNYTSAVYLTTAFLPHLASVSGGGHLVFVSATLGLVPSLIRTPNYNASKAALHAFIMAVRQQLKEANQAGGGGGGGSGVRIVEVFPPAVQTELHDAKHQPDLVDGGEIGMPLDVYTEKMYEGLVRGDEQFAVGPGEALLREGGWEDQRRKLFQEQNVAIQGMLSKYLKK
ncbi:hypothetical protein N3K66_007270 [Trichothecium roseum]|uniref:Uncharacterized protein n=1 Tax=Trichothecium roseum TaxID=47278 RepID=A0ACC0UV68_9HYPO|nr:hypothetical protein N3K66_007270 [Trichothecium roseum]